MVAENIENYIKKIVSLRLNEETTKELVFDFYKIVASHYRNKVPESVYKIFITNLPSFEKYAYDIMMDLETKVNNINDEINNLLIKINELEQKVKETISIRKNKVYVDSKYIMKKPTVDTLYGSIEVNISVRHLPTFKEVTTKRVIGSNNIKKVALTLGYIIQDYKSKTPEELNKAAMNLLLRQVKEENGEKFIYENMYNIFVKNIPGFEEYFKLKNNKEELLVDIEKYRKEIEQLEKVAKTIKKQIIKVKK